MSSASEMSTSPIGIFDSGYGGLTVLREIRSLMPDEATIFVGDTAHFPYGPRDLSEVRNYVLAICDELASRGCKLIVIACNTATAAGLKVAQRTFNIPIVGVVEPGSRAAVHMTRNRKVGVIATQGTVDSGAYADAILNLDAGVDVHSVATPEFVDIAEAGLQFRLQPADAASNVQLDPMLVVCDRGVLDCDSAAVYEKIAARELAPLRESGIDTLVLGCTHFPLIQPLIQDAMGAGVSLVSSAEETAREVHEVLERRHQLVRSQSGRAGAMSEEYLVTGHATSEFRRFGTLVMGRDIGSVEHLPLWD